MPFRYSIETDFIRIQWHGEPAKADFDALGDLMPRLAAQLQRAPHVLHTFDDVTRNRMQPLDAFQHSLRLQDTRFPNPVRSAAVARTPEVRAMARLVCELNRSPDLTMKLFANEEEAAAWLRSV